MENPENIRVDLLKFRQKAFLSYPEGSKERKMFIKAALEKELRTVSKETPHELINLVMLKSEAVSRKYLKDFLLWGSLSIACYISYPLIHTLWSLIFLFPASICLSLMLRVVKDYLLYRKDLKEIKTYSKYVQVYMSKLLTGIQKLDNFNKH